MRLCFWRILEQIDIHLPPRAWLTQPNGYESLAELGSFDLIQRLKSLCRRNDSVPVL